MFWGKRQELFIDIVGHVADAGASITLADLTNARASGAGVAGRLLLGGSNIGLWTPQVRPSDIANNSEWVCDLRYAPLSHGKTYEMFCEAVKDANLSCHAVLFRGTNPYKIAAALEHFDFVIVPSRRIKNRAEDLRKGVLSYGKKPLKYKLSPHIKDD
jgi:hypothetical protein